MYLLFIKTIATGFIDNTLFFQYFARILISQFIKTGKRGNLKRGKIKQIVFPVIENTREAIKIKRPIKRIHCKRHPENFGKTAAVFLCNCKRNSYNQKQDGDNGNTKESTSVQIHERRWR